MSQQYLESNLSNNAIASVRSMPITIPKSPLNTSLL